MTRRNSILALLTLLALSACQSGFDINGKFYSDKQLARFRSSWNNGLINMRDSQAAPFLHQYILDVISQQEAIGMDGSPCRDLVLTAVVPLQGAFVRISGRNIEAVRFFEDWRVMACNEQHSWFVQRGLKGLKVLFPPAVPGRWAETSTSQLPQVNASD